MKRQNEDGDFPIHIAARCNLQQIVQLLLKEFSDINTQNGKKESVLFIASSNGYEDIVNELINKDADLNIPNKHGNTAIMAAVTKGHATVVKTLLEANADLNITNNDHQNILHLVTHAGQKEVLEILLPYVKIPALLQQLDTFDENPCHVAAKKCSINCLGLLFNSELMNRKIAVAKNLNGDTPCHLAAKTGEVSVLEPIIHKYPFTINLRNNHNETPIEIAAANGKLECVEWLRCKASGSCPDVSKSILDIAAKNGHVNIVKRVLEDTKNYKKDTVKKAFWIAFNNNHSPVLETLLDYNKDGLEILSNNANWRSKKNYATPMRGLIKKYPDVAEKVLDKCIDDEMVSDYTYIDDQDGNDDEIQTVPEKDIQCCSNSNRSLDDHPMMIMAQERHENLLKHPVSLTWTKQQWRSYGRLMFLVEFIPYLLYIIFLTKYATEEYNTCNFIKVMNITNSSIATQVSSPCPNMPNSTFLSTYAIDDLNICHFVKLTNSSDNSDCQNEENIIYLSKYTTSGDNKCHFSRVMKRTDGQSTNETIECDTSDIITKVLVSFFTGICLLYEMLQFQESRLKYFCYTSNIIDLALYCSTFLVLWGPGIDLPFKYCNSDMCWKWSLGAYLLTCAWLNLLRYLRFFSFFGIFLLMFVRILKTVVKLSLMLGIFILAFSFSFRITIIDQKPFHGFGWSYLKTLTMAMGEFTYDEVFRGDEKVKFHTTTILTFIALIIVLTIVLMNMLIGIAVNNINSVQKDAELERIVTQIKVVLRMKRPWCSKCTNGHDYITAVFRKIYKTYEKLPDCLKPRMSHFMSSENIQKLCEDKLKAKNSKGNLREKVDSLREDIYALPKKSYDKF